MPIESTQTSEADFFKLKASLIDFLRTKPDLSDYNFDGSALNVLTDVLAYGAHIQAAHANLVFSEAFLDSAQQRASVVSHAKQLGYVPKSRTAPYAVLNVSFSVAGNPSQYVVPKNTKFTATVNGTSYFFVTVEDTIIERNVSGTYTGSLTVYQGKFTEYNYIASNSETQRYLVPSEKVDTKFLTVSVAASISSSVFEEFAFVDELEISTFGPDTSVFFMQESYDGFFQVYFGNGTIGKSLSVGNLVKLNYLITDGPLANGARLFSLSSTLPSVSAFSITTSEVAQNGAEKESIDSIKFLAPFYYQAQKRAVTETDYKAILKANYADIDDVAVWGGEKNIPPFYGKVFLAVKPKNSTYFSNFIKQSIQNNIISRFNVLSIRPEIVDPDYIDVSVNTVVTYNSKLFKPGTSVNLAQLIQTKIETFFASETNKFGSILNYSKLVAAIDSVSSLILNSITNITLQKSSQVFIGSAGTYSFEYNNSIHPGSLFSNDFVIAGTTYKLRDVPSTTDSTTGVLQVYRVTEGGTVIILQSNAGSINYNTGLVTVSNFKLDSILVQSEQNRLILTVSPGTFVDVTNPNAVFTNYNVYTNKRNQLIRLNPLTTPIVTLLPDAS